MLVLVVVWITTPSPPPYSIIVTLNPDRDTRLSPAQILLARQLRDAMPTHPSNLKLRKEWLLTADAREKAFSTRHQRRHDQLSQHTRHLQHLAIGDIMQVQNQRGPHANKWDLSGSITEQLDFDAYMVRMDGSGRISKCNRQFLKKILPFKSAMSPPASSPSVGIPVCNHYYSGPTADKAGTPCATASQTEAAAAKSTPEQLPDTDTEPTEIRMSDGLTQAV